jgi:hypothetical protein
MPNRNRARAHRRAAAFSLGLALGLGLLALTLNLVGVARASEPKDDPDQTPNAVIGLASNALPCLVAGDDLTGQASGTVRLSWRGQIERARLVLSAA